MNSIPVAEVVSTEWADTVAPVTTPTKGQIRKARAASLAQRGMVTAEYAVGILAAIALALVLVKVFNDNAFFTELLKQVTALIGQMSKKLG